MPRLRQNEESFLDERSAERSGQERPIRIIRNRHNSTSESSNRTRERDRDESSSEEEKLPDDCRKITKMMTPSRRGNNRRKRDPLNRTIKSPLEPKYSVDESLPREQAKLIDIIEKSPIEQPPLDLDDPSNYEERFLTKEEIDYILDIIPETPAAIPELGKIVQQQLKNVLKMTLLRRKVIPIGINILRGEIKHNFYKSLIQAGKTIGITCSESFGQPLTQTNLGTFHSAGRASAGTSDTNSITEMFNISPERKNEFTTIHFKNKNLSYDEVFEMKRRIIGVSLIDLIKSRNFNLIDESEPLNKRGWWYDMIGSLKDIETDNNSPIRTAKVFLRLNFNRKQLYSYDISTTEIANVINGKDVVRTCVCVPSPTSSAIIDIYPSRDVKSILKNCFNKNEVNPFSYKDLPDAGIEVLFLQQCIVNKMSEIIVKGVPGLKSIIPQPVKLTMHLKHAEKISQKDETISNSNNKDIKGNKDEKSLSPKPIIRKHGVYQLLTGEEITYLKDSFLKYGYEEKDLDNFEDKIWKIFIDDISLRVLGVPILKIVRFLEACGFRILYAPPDIEEEFYNNRKIFNPLYSQLGHNGIFVYPPDDIGDKKPLDYIKALVDKATNDVEATKTNVRKREPTINDDLLENLRKFSRVGSKVTLKERYQEIAKHSVYVYGEASGINMRALMANPYVDSSRCKCNNFHQMLEVFGIEVTRNTYIREFHEHITNSGSFISPRYLILIAEFVTNQGLLIPITSRGVARQNIGTFAKMSFEQAMPVVTDAAAFGKEENIKSTSTAIFVGRRAVIGTGMCQPVPDEEMLENNFKAAGETAERAKNEQFDNVVDKIQAGHFTKSEELKGIGGDNTEAGEDTSSSWVSLYEDNPKETSTESFPLWPKVRIPTIKVSNVGLSSWVKNLFEGIPETEPAKAESNGGTEKVAVPSGGVSRGRVSVTKGLSKPSS